MQLLANTAVSASAILLVALGFLLIFAVARFFHFAHGVVFTAGAYFAFVATRELGLPLLAAMLVSLVLASVLGGLIELTVYRPLRGRGATPLMLLLGSLGVYIFLQNALSLAFGDDTRMIRSSAVAPGIRLLGASLTPAQVAIVCAGVAFPLLVLLILRRTVLGRAMQAVASDPELSLTCGIDSGRVTLATFALGSALAGLAGVLVALDADMTPTMGLNALMLAVVTVIIGGVSSLGGVVLGALLLGAAQQFGAWQFGAQWQEVVALLLLLAFLLVRPQGILGRRLRKAEV